MRISIAQARPKETFSTKHLRESPASKNITKRETRKSTKTTTEKNNKNERKKRKEKTKTKNYPKDPKVRHIISYLLAHKVPKIMAKGNWNPPSDTMLCDVSPIACQRVNVNVRDDASHRMNPAGQERGATTKAERLH